MKAVVILGAGFSNNSGIPVQSEIPEMLLNYGNENGFDRNVSEVIERFTKEVFGYTYGNYFPSLDDIFTCIDISTNSGHHIGIKYSPMHLRALRRLLVYRVFSILHNRFTPNKDVEGMLTAIFRVFSKVDFVVLNWDTVLESYIHRIFPKMHIEYRNSGINWRGKQTEKNPKAEIYKMHGSSNWLYCDNCRALLYDTYNDIPLIKKAGFQELDFILFPEIKYWKRYAENQEKCKACGNIISSHIATFRYRKSFRANSFANIWSSAENILSEADKWIFIGYSLPEADYEFKHLLKISQLKYKHIGYNTPEVDVVLLKSDQTINKYRGFFGDSLGRVCNNGINEYTDYLQNML